jgi:hypothetical protein
MSRKLDPIDSALEKLVSPSVFDEIVKEVNATHIPTEYVERVVVYYNNGDIVEMLGEQINHPIPLSRNGSWSKMSDMFENLKEVKVFIDTAKLEHDVNQELAELLDS